MWCKKTCGCIVVGLAAVALFGAGIGWNNSSPTPPDQYERLFSPDEIAGLTKEQVLDLYRQRMADRLGVPVSAIQPTAGPVVIEPALPVDPSSVRPSATGAATAKSQKAAKAGLVGDGQGGGEQAQSEGNVKASASGARSLKNGLPASSDVSPSASASNTAGMNALQVRESRKGPAGYEGDDFGVGNANQSKSFRSFLSKLEAEGRSDDMANAYRDWENVQNNRPIGTPLPKVSAGGTTPAPSQGSVPNNNNGRSGGFITFGGGDCNTNGINDIDELTPIFEDWVKNPNINFPDFVETTDTITVTAGSGDDMEDLNVDLVVTHIFMGDTTYSLDNPTPQNISLMAFAGGGTDNCDILFDDSASGPPGGTMIGTFKPATPLSTFPLDGGSRNGNWVIHCLDTFGGSGTGTLNQWSLHFRTFGAPDCNSNGVLDECDIAGGTSDDCNFNGLPDECETGEDCNTNGVPDDCDTIGGSSLDCNTNQVPDECEQGDCSAPGADWDNGPVDGTDGLANQIGGIAPAQVADNYVGGAADTSIDLMTFSDVEDTTYAWDGTVQIATYENNGSGTPLEAAFGLQLLSGSDIGRVQNGTLFGRPLWEYTLDADVDAPGAGTHWVSATPSSGGGSGQAFWLTSAVPSNFPSSYFRSTFFGFPTWTPMVNVYGQDLDFAFTLTFGGCGDCNTNGQLDVCDIADGSSLDCNGDEVPDECQDCNGNGKADECDILGGTSADCNTNELPDECDIAAGSSGDCNGDGVPDECQDCNTNGLADQCDVESGDSADCNTNVIPDECEDDCNTNGFADVCDIDGGTAIDDCNTNGIPDECEGATVPPGPDWDNGAPDGTDGLANQVGGVAPAQVADNFTAGAADSSIAEATFSDVEDTAYAYNGTVQAATYGDAGGFPNEVETTLEIVVPVDRVQNGTVFGRPRWDYTLEVDLEIPDAGNNWVSLTPQSDGSGGQAFWLTSAVPSNNPTSYFRSSFFGFPTWTPTQNVIGVDWDFAFTLTFGGGDCNSNGQLDVCDIAEGAADCNTNETPDECELVDGDCNTNNILDVCDIADGTSPGDCNTDEVPDECQDCNTNDLADQCELVPPTTSVVLTPGINYPDFVETTDSVTLGGGSALDVNVDLVVSHIFMGDTQYWLDRDGSTINLMINVGGSSQNANILFDDEADSSPPAGGPLTGTFKPAQALSTIEDGSQAGTWTIHCFDTFGGSGTGTLNQWSLHFQSGPAPENDCDTDGILDVCELGGGTSVDCNSNELPDDCEPDCNTNGLADECDLDAGAEDCNTNTIPDECEIGDCSAPGADWDNGPPDQIDGLANQIGGVAPAEVADDFDAGGGPTSIAIVTFSDVEDTTYSWNGTVQVSSWGNSGGTPNEAFVDQKLEPNDGGSIGKVQNGTLFGRPLYDYTIETDVNVPGGVSWFSATPASDGASGQAFWLTSHVPAVFGDSFFRSSFFGFPTWTPMANVYGQDLDFSFTLTFGGCKDCNSNGQLDVCDIGDGSSLDCNGDEVPDECQDCNTNGKADECDLLGGTSTDCNTNDIIDVCDIGFGSSLDCDLDGLPDDCEPDCNTNGVNDECDIANGDSEDCDGDGVPDECELDCNTNEVPDDCDINNGSSTDCDTNTIPDECDIGDCSGPGPDWDNGPPDGTDGLANQIGGVAPAECADDFDAGPSATTIELMTFSDVEDTIYTWNGTVLVSSWPDNGGGAPSEVANDQNLEPTDGGTVSRVQNGTVFGRPRWDYTIETEVDVASGGVSWVSATPASDGGSGQAFWLTSAVPANFGQSYFRSSFFGFPTWVPTNNIVGQNWDFAFTLTLGGCKDCNSNGQLDVCDIGQGLSGDCNDDDTPDECQDCNGNGLADECDLLGGSATDCNENDILDECDIASGSSIDCDGNGLPDECDPDCNQNGFADACDIAGGTSDDCQPDGIPDECQLGECGPGPHWNNGGVNGVNGNANQEGGVAPGENCDDYDPGQGFTIVGATFSDVEDTTYSWNGEIHASVYTNNGSGAPNEAAFSSQILSGADATRVANGTLFGRPRWDYTLMPELPTPAGEVAWFSPVPRSGGSSGQAFWLTSATPATFGQSYFRSSFFGFPTWTQTNSVVGQNWDFAFTLTFDCEDCNTDGVPDDCDPDDCNTDGTPDECQEFADCNSNGIPDVCEFVDCNTNCNDDADDIASGDSEDCNENGIPDECEPNEDCNSNGLLDECEEDCNTNGVPDDCDLIPQNPSDYVLTPDVNFPDLVEVTDSLVISNPTEFLDVNVDLVVQTGFLGDCDFWLDHDGLTVFLMNNQGGSCSSPNDILFDDEAGGFPAGCPIVGTFLPNQPLSAFDANGDQQGTWTIHALDTFSGSGTGHLTSWSLHFTPAGTSSQDCNTNDVPDECDIASGNSEDANGDGIPDECVLCTCQGDLNDDGNVDGDDIQCFVDCIITGTTTNCASCACADMDSDGDVDSDDLDDFVDKLLNDPTPCP